MAFSYKSGRLTIFGSISTTQSWSINFGFEPGGADPSSSDLSTWLPTLDTPISTWWNTANGPKACNSSDTLVTGVRAEFYDAGASVPIASASHSFGTALAGFNSQYSPTQTSMCHTLLSAYSGQHYRGRVYVPTTALTLGSNHQPSSTFVDALSVSMANLIHAINISTLAASAPLVCIRGTGALSPSTVTSVRVDSEPDVQRRRADKVLASYTKTTSV